MNETLNRRRRWKRRATVHRHGLRERRLLDAIPDPLLLTASDGRIIDVNRATEMITGRPRRELLGTEFSDHFADPLEARLLHERVLSDGEARNVALAFRHREGHVTKVLYSALRYRDRRGGARGVLATARGITQRELTEGGLRELTSVATVNLESPSYAIFCTDVRGTIEIWSRAAARQLGYSNAEVVDAMTPLAFHDPEEIAVRAAELSRELGRQILPGAGVLTLKAELAGPGEPHEREWTYVCTDGRRLRMLVSVTALRDPDGTLTGFLHVGRDITRRKEVERLKKEFISTVSHELRTPLTSIRGALGLLEGGALGVLPEPAREIVQIARFNSERLIRLVNDILDIEKIDAGRLELEIEDLDPAELVAATLKENRASAEQAGVTLTAEVATAGLVRADRDRIVQVVTNLLSNAVKFSSRDSTVSLTVAAGAAGRVRFAVTDHGLGIAAEQIEKLFGRFQQLDSSDSRQKGGTGLGLAISKAIVEHHGGEIGVESRVGVGSTFWFELPRSVEPMSRRSVLLVAKDEALSGAVEMVLHGGGYRVTRASSAAEAIERLPTCNPEAVILDRRLPDGDEIDLLERPELHDTPVVVVTGGERREELIEKLKVMDWRHEPQSSRLLTALRRAIGRRRTAQVLVVDDDPSVRALLVAQLGKLGVDCVEAADGAQAIQLTRSRLPDLIILDLVMLGMDGFQVVDVLRRETAQATPLIVYSAKDTTAAERRQLTLGPTMHLTKARASEAELLAAVESLLEAPKGP